MSQALTINLSDELFLQLQQVAQLGQQTPETVIVQSLAHSLPPLLDEVPQLYQADVYPLLTMGESELQNEVKQVFPHELWVEYEDLLQQKKARTLSSQETNRFDQLRYSADLVTFRKAYAAVLLKRQGYSVPTQPELAPVS